MWLWHFPNYDDLVRVELINWNPNFVFEFNFSLVAIAVQSCQQILLLSLTMGSGQSAGAGLSATCLFQAEPHANQSHTQLTLQDLELWFSRIVSCPSPLGKPVWSRSIYLCFYRGLKPQTQLPPWSLEQNELKIDNSCLIPLEFSLVFCFRPL